MTLTYDLDTCRFYIDNPEQDALFKRPIYSYAELLDVIQQLHDKRIPFIVTTERVGWSVLQVSTKDGEKVES